MGPKESGDRRGGADDDSEDWLSGDFNGDRIRRRFSLLTSEGLGLFPASLPARHGDEDGGGADMIGEG